MEQQNETHLELIDERHITPLFQLIEDNRSYLRTWLPWVDFMQTEDSFRHFVKGAKRRCADKEELSFVIVSNDKPVGRIGLYYMDHRNKITSIGYWLAEGFQGKGIITNMCRQLITYGFNEMDFNRIEIKCGTENYKSQAIPERLGFVKEGIIRNGELVNDRFIDLYLYAMLRKDWPYTNHELMD